MFNYEPDYAYELQKMLKNMEDGKVKDSAKSAIYRYIYEDIADEYENTHSNEEITQKHREFCAAHDFVSGDIAKLIYLIDDNTIGYVLDIVYDIVNAIDDMAYDRGYDDGFEQCEKEEIDFIIDTSGIDKSSSYYKPIISEGNIQELVKNGLCCAMCKYYKDGYCWNKAFPRINMIKPKPYQICECIKFDGEKYNNYYFDGKQFCKRSNQTICKKSHFSDVAIETVDKMKNIISENEDFISFMKEEIPEVYKKLYQEFRKRKEILK